MYKTVFKRLIDLLLSTVAFIVLFPVFLVVSVLLAIANDGKPFFVQPRPGKNREIFKVIKFKTMNDKKDANGILLSDSERLTHIGKIIRRTSLDEIPQLLNVIKGDMSLIGPRPLLIRYLPYYTEEESVRFQVRPGITGLAQVSGRNTLNWDKRLSFDVFYVKNLSFLLDVKIILQTISNVFTSKDVVIDPTAMMQDLDYERINANKAAN